MPDVLTIREAVIRCKAEGLPVSEYTLRGWIKTGVIPARKVGRKALLFYPNLVRYIQCQDTGGGSPDPAEERCGIRRLEVRV